MKIRRIWLKNVGHFGELDIEIPAGTDPDRADVVLITGPNGSGKTTLLELIATVLVGGDQVTRRWNQTSCVAAEVSILDASSFVVLSDRLVQGPPGMSVDLSRKDWPDWVKNRSFHSGVLGAPGPQRVLTPDGYGALNGFGSFFAGVAGPVFAYSARRRLESGAVSAFTDDPINGTTSWADSERSIEPGAFEQWVGNTKVKTGLAREDGDLQGVARYERAIDSVQACISELIDEPFSLKVQREPLQVLGVINGFTVPLSSLPDGLRSALAWLGDVLSKLDRLPRDEGVDPLNWPLTILIDEIDLHLHPEWQRKILHVAERLLPNAQIFATTHSPFVVQSATDACIIKLGPHGKTAEVFGPQHNRPADLVLEDVLGVRGDSYSVEIEARLTVFKEQRNRVLRGEEELSNLEATARDLASLDESLEIDLGRQLVQVKERLRVS